MSLLVPPFAAQKGSSLINTLRNLSLTTSLQVCLDAGDLNSYDGSSQTWKDLSGGGNDFYRGSGSGSDASDPTFNGTAGRKTTSDYFSYDGADLFTMTQSPPAWQSGMHKAGGAFTLLQWIYVGNLTTTAPTQAGFGCGEAAAGASATDAVTFTNSGSTQNAMSISVSDSVPSQIVGNKSTLLVTNNAWQMIAVAVTINTGAILFAVNASSETRPNAGSGSPSAVNSHASMVIGAVAADNYASAINGCRIAAAAVWTRALSAAELLSIYNDQRARYGL